jgi:hypothetical protein
VGAKSTARCLRRISSIPGLTLVAWATAGIAQDTPPPAPDAPTTAATASAAPARLALAQDSKPVEHIDPTELISGSAATGLVLYPTSNGMAPRARIGRDRLWAFLPPASAPGSKEDALPDALKLEISSIDGRYYAELDYTTAGHQGRWVALDLSSLRFAFLEEQYKEPQNEIAVLLRDREGKRFYPVTWGEPFPNQPEKPALADVLRLYMNTERASAFLLVDKTPTPCKDASSVSAFKFNAICEVPIGHLSRMPESANQNAVDVYRRSGVRALSPISVNVVYQD